MCSAPSELRGDEGRLDLAVKASTWAPAAWMHSEAKVGNVVQMRVGKDIARTDCHIYRGLQKLSYYDIKRISCVILYLIFYI